MPRYSVRTTEKFHRVAVRSKPRGKRRWGMLHLGDGIMAARFKANGKWRTQSVLFPKDKYTAEEAVKWVKAKRHASVAGRGNPGNPGKGWW